MFIEASSGTILDDTLNLIRHLKSFLLGYKHTQQKEREMQVMIARKKTKENK